MIPLIMVFNKQLLAGQPLPVSLKELAEHPKAFGGKTNSAGRGVYKQLTWLYGKEFTDLFMENATIFDMPVQSLQSVQKGLSPAAITPSIFAFRADETLLSLRYPKEGALTVPSFIAVKKTHCQPILPDGFCQNCLRLTFVITLLNMGKYSHVSNIPKM